MLANLYFALTHIASQILFRWLPQPSAERLQNLETQNSLTTQDASVALSSFSIRDWQDFISWEGLRDETVLLWLRPYLEKQDKDGRGLAIAIFEHCRHVREAGGLYLTLPDARYPPLLRAINDPPLGLTILGDPNLLTRTIISIVGSRKASGRAIGESFALGRTLAEQGFVIASGGAYGCDIAAHQGVLASSLTDAAAILVFAGGLHKLYPRGLASVFRQLECRRAVFLSERLWRASCQPWDFPARNRIIAGLANLTIVMQAAEKSGALITANFALDQGRDLAVLAHPADDVRASGSQKLIQDGAWSFQSGSELLAGLGLQFSDNASL